MWRTLFLSTGPVLQLCLPALQLCLPVPVRFYSAEEILRPSDTDTLSPSFLLHLPSLLFRKYNGHASPVIHSPLADVVSTNRIAINTEPHADLSAPSLPDDP